MNIFCTKYKLEEETVRDMINDGFLDPKIIYYEEIYNYYLRRIAYYDSKKRKSFKRDAIFDVIYEYRITVRTFYRIKEYIRMISQ